jgi:hypothetical protein
MATDLHYSIREAIMRCIALTLMAVGLMWASAPAERQSSVSKTHRHRNHSATRNPGAWDPGYTLYNPFGLPPWMRHPGPPLPPPRR